MSVPVPKRHSGELEVADGIPKESIDMSYASWRNHASKGNSYHLIQRMDKFYNDLWEGSQNESDQSTADNC